MTQPIEAAALAANGTGPQPAHAAAHATPSLPAVPSHRAWVPRWFVTVLHAGEAAVSHLRPVAMSPEVDQLIEAALRADGLGAEASLFHAAIDLINGGVERHLAAQQQFLPAPDAQPEGGA